MGLGAGRSEGSPLPAEGPEQSRELSDFAVQTERWRCQEVGIPAF